MVYANSLLQQYLRYLLGFEPGVFLGGCQAPAQRHQDGFHHTSHKLRQPALLFAHATAVLLETVGEAVLPPPLQVPCLHWAEQGGLFSHQSAPRLRRHGGSGDCTYMPTES